MKRERVIYYSDVLNDDFADTDIRTKRVGADFPYRHAPAPWRIAAFLLYYAVAAPIVFLISKLYLGLKFENRRVLRELRGSGFYLYGNHTRNLDAFVPSMAAFPKRAYIVSSPDAVSIPLLRNTVQMLGAIPVPTETAGMRPFTEAVYAARAAGGCVAVYPEAHVWPLYTGIRPFPDTSFRYPVRDGAPVVAMVTTYRRRTGLFRFCSRPGMTVTFSRPMTADPSLSLREAQRDLRDRVRDFMLEVSSGRENVEYIRYEKRGG
jgi:1-acyl-sn-glycerol-3-phosphate acyltransferase